MPYFHAPATPSLSLALGAPFAAEVMSLYKRVEMGLGFLIAGLRLPSAKQTGGGKSV